MHSNWLQSYQEKVQGSDRKHTFPLTRPSMTTSRGGGEDHREGMRTSCSGTLERNVWCLRCGTTAVQIEDGTAHTADEDLTSKIPSPPPHPHPSMPVSPTPIPAPFSARTPPYLSPSTTGTANKQTKNLDTARPGVGATPATCSSIGSQRRPRSRRRAVRASLRCNGPCSRSGRAP